MGSKIYRKDGFDWHGSLITCDEGGAIVGICSSGALKDCDKNNHQIWCDKGVPVDNTSCVNVYAYH